MPHKLVSLALIFLLSPTSLALASNVHGVIVGVDDYGGAADLEGCEEDAKAMWGFLSQHFGPQRTRLSLLTDTRADGRTLSWSTVDAALQRAGRHAQPEDYLYLYYSGHGNRRGLALPGGETVDGARLAASLSKVKAGHVFVILDSCFSGALIAPLHRALDASKRLFVLTAVSASETAKTCQVGPNACPVNKSGGSVFTSWLLRAMRDRKNDRNRDGWVSWREALNSAGASIANVALRAMHPSLASRVALDMTPQFYER